MSEELCLKCGRCCYIKQRVGRFFIERERCKHLKSNNECGCYSTRHSAYLQGGNVCITAKESIERGLHPPYCPYVKHYLKGKKYKYKVIRQADGKDTGGMNNGKKTQ